MRISALVTTYRRFWKCCRAIDAIIRQTHPVDEIIVVDNGSPEPEYLGLHARYEAAAVPVVVVRLSRGTHTLPPLRDDLGTEIATCSRDTTNVAVGLARGDWLATCHDDDEWMPDRIAAGVAAIRRHPHLSLVGCHVIDRTESGDVLGVHHDAYPPHGDPLGDGVTDVTACASSFNPLAVSGLLFSRRLAAEAGPWQAWLPGGMGAYMRSLSASDWDFYVRATRTTRLGRIDRPLVWYEVGNTKHEGHQVHG